MSVKSTDQAYGLAARALHWSIALLIIAQFAIAWYADGLPKPERIEMIRLHKSVGMIVLMLGAIRLLWWALDSVRPGDGDLTWEKWPSRLVKWSLAFLAAGMPLSGWLMSSADKYPVSLFGLVTFPPLLEPDKELGHLLKAVHENLGVVILILVALHVGGALRHHFILKDRILLRMVGR